MFGDLLLLDCDALMSMATPAISSYKFIEADLAIRLSPRTNHSHFNTLKWTGAPVKAINRVIDPAVTCLQDIVAVMRAAIRLQGSLKHRVFNMGGPERLSRVDMANKVRLIHQL